LYFITLHLLMTLTYTSLVLRNTTLLLTVRTFLNTLLIIIVAMVAYVFACLVDFSKAFDSVDYWQLFCKMWDLSECHANRLST